MLRKKFVLHNSLLLITLFIALLANAQNTFKAIIKDSETKEKLIGSTVYIKELKLSSSADTSGTITLTGIPNGKFEIVFSYIGYDKKEINFSFPLIQQQPIEIFLKNESREFTEVIVTSTRTNSRIEDIPVRIEVIGEEEVNEEGSRQIFPCCLPKAPACRRSKHLPQMVM